MHNGVDLAAKKGTPILAVMGGVVEAVAYQKGGAGWYVKVRNGNGLESLYMHMNTKSPLKVGQTIYPGQVIGQVGATGAATGAHLHFEVRQNGKAINPMPFLQGSAGMPSLPSPMGGGNVKFSGKALYQAPRLVQDYIDQAHLTYGVKPQLIAAVIKAESNFNYNARSPVGAYGLMQLMPSWGSGRMNPRTNVMLGTQFLRNNLKKYGDVRFALAAYNWGPGKLDKAIKKYGRNWSALQPHLPPETRNYVERVLSYL